MTVILNQSYGKDKEIRRLLTRSLVNMDPVQINAWMKSVYDPSRMFISVENNQIVACLQTKERIFRYKGKDCSAMVLALACTLPDYRQRKHFSRLFDAAMNVAANNHLVSLAYTSFPKLLNTRSFQTVSKTKYYWLEAGQCTKGNEKNIKTYRPDINLYPFYLDFMSHFDGSIVYTAQQFQNQLHYYLNCNHRIAVMSDGENDLRGFAVYKVIKEHIEIKYLLYLDSDALFDLFKYLAGRCQSLSFTVSERERFEKLFPMEIGRNQGYVLARLNNYKLFSIWSHTKAHHAEEAFKDPEKPMWNHWID